MWSACISIHATQCWFNMFLLRMMFVGQPRIKVAMKDNLFPVHHSLLSNLVRFFGMMWEINFCGGFGCGLCESVVCKQVVNLYAHLHDQIVLWSYLLLAFGSWLGYFQFWLVGSAVSVYELTCLQSLHVNLWIRTAPTKVNGHFVGLVASLANAMSCWIQDVSMMAVLMF
jgi:hypothetical protein